MTNIPLHDDMVAWGSWAGPDLYEVTAHCGSSCDHVIRILVLEAQLLYAEVDVFAHLEVKMRKEFDEVHDHA
jgi:hypothetical protein